MHKYTEELEKEVEPLALYDFIESYEGLPMMQLWDWLMYNGYTKRVKEQEQTNGMDVVWKLAREQGND